jgi:hypothetical protein
VIIAAIRFVAVLLLVLVAGAGIFLAGMFAEYQRPGGTADLERRLRTVTRLRPVGGRETAGLSRGVSR